MMKQLMPLAISLFALSQTPAYAQGEGRRAIKAKDLSQEQIAEALKEKAHQNRLELITKYEEVLAKDSIQGDQRASLLFRVAEQYFAEGSYFFFKEMENFQVEYDKCFNTKGCNVDKMKPDNKVSHGWQKKAIDNYQKVLNDFPNYSRADEVLYYLGTALQEIKEPKKALKQFERLTKEYPRSQYLPDAYVNIGEYYFDNNSAMKALAAYQSASQFTTAKTYGYAMYKLAWCYYNVQNYENSIETMKRVVSYSQEQAQLGAGKTNLMLQEDALKDMVRFYADADDMDGAYAYFTQLGRKELILLMLKRLGEAYFEQGKYEQCVAAYRRLINEEEMSEKAPDYQYQIVKAYEKMGQKGETLKEIQKLRATYGKDSAWARTNASKVDDIKRANRHLEEGLRTAANAYHTEARKLGGNKQAIVVSQQAEQAYRLYIQDFPSETYSYDIRYNFGELLFDLGDFYKNNKSEDPEGVAQEKYYEDAFNQYSNVIEQDPKGKYAERCANANIALASNMMDREEKKGLIKKRKNDKDLSVIDLAPWETKYLTAMENFAEVYPKSKVTIDYLYESGNLYFDKNRLDEAAKKFRQVIDLQPSSKQAANAAEGIADALAFRADARFKTEEYGEALKDYIALRDAAKDFYDQKSLGNPKFKEKIYGYFEKSSAKVVETVFNGSARDEAAKAEAAKGYRQFVTDFPKSELAPAALNTAAIYFFESNNVALSMEARQTMVSAYPTSKYYLEHMAKVGFNYESIADFSQAADWYERLFKEAPEYQDTKSALYRASFFRKRMGQWEQAIKNMRDYMKAYPDESLTVTLPIDIANVYQEYGKLEKAASEFEAYYKKPNKEATDENIFFARLQHSQILGQQRKTTYQAKVWQGTIDEFAKYTERMAKEEKAPSAIVRTYVAEIMYYMAKDQNESYLKLKIDGPKGSASPAYVQRVLNTQIKTKIEKLKEIKETYEKIVLVQGGKWSLEALVEIGKAYDNYAETIVQSYVPTFLDEEIYKMKLEDQAFSYRQKGIAFYEKAIEVAFQNSLYTKATEYAMQRLGEFDPERYSKREEDILSPSYLSKSTRSRVLIKTIE